jgi:hypothetical protein
MKKPNFPFEKNMIIPWAPCTMFLKASSHAALARTNQASAAFRIGNDLKAA